MVPRQIANVPQGIQAGVAIKAVHQERTNYLALAMAHVRLLVPVVHATVMKDSLEMIAELTLALHLMLYTTKSLHSVCVQLVAFVVSDRN